MKSGRVKPDAEGSLGDDAGAGAWSGRDFRLAGAARLLQP
jgi:hypothetical protein